jgi:hypothetical protein
MQGSSGMGMGSFIGSGMTFDFEVCFFKCLIILFQEIVIDI